MTCEKFDSEFRGKLQKFFAFPVDVIDETKTMLTRTELYFFTASLQEEMSFDYVKGDIFAGVTIAEIRRISKQRYLEAREREGRKKASQKLKAIANINQLSLGETQTFKA